MINISRPVSIFTVFLRQNFSFKDQSFVQGHNQIKRGEPLEDGSENPNLYVYHSNDMFQKPYLVVNNKCVKEVLRFVKSKQIEEGDYGDYGNEDMTQ